MRLVGVPLGAAIVLSAAITSSPTGPTGCAHAPVQPRWERRAEYLQSEYEPYGAKGTASIAGQGFLRTRGGDVKYCAGSPVHLNPVTEYSTEWWVVGCQKGYQLSAPDYRADTYTRATYADGEGRFVFEELAPGDYYVVTSVAWERPAASLSGYGFTTPTGGVVGARVHVEPGQRTTVVLQPLRISP